jgi:hypothetical protein
MITIEYTPEDSDASVADGMAMDIALQIAAETAARTYTWRSANANVFDCLRVLIAEGKLDPQAILFRHNGQDFRPNKYGDLHPWPAGFCELNANWAERILHAAIKQYQARQEALRVQKDEAQTQAVDRTGPCPG